jgi:hypothetical protein
LLARGFMSPWIACSIEISLEMRGEGSLGWFGQFLVKRTKFFWLVMVMELRDIDLDYFRHEMRAEI